MDKFFCNPSYPILFNSASSFSENSIGDSIANSNSDISSAQELYDFFFDDNYKEQIKEQINKNDKK